MTAHSQQRFELARRLTPACASLLSTRTILLTGSVAEGCTDEHSDIVAEHIPNMDAWSLRAHL